MSAVRAVAFDFNGTLSHDEPILYAIYRDMFSEQGRPLSETDYYGKLAGLSEETIIGM
jgi:beta-phosphoglucomutase-like phosphatase (HAD superfamily)